LQQSDLLVARILREIHELSQIGGHADGSVTRLAYTQADTEARMWLVNRMEEAGLRTEVDAVGNVFGWPPNSSTDPPILLGSHVDTVPGGGMYDGTLGVVSALEIVRSLADRENRVPPVGVVSFACEEGSRFGMSSIGSRAVTGQLVPGDLERLKDRDGITLRQALQSAGLSPKEVHKLQRAPGWFRAYLEGHIDQGPELEETGCPVGVVKAIAGVSRYLLTFHGAQAHAGAARMGQRRDAMAAAAEAILIIEHEATSAAEDVVATVGVAEIVPGIINVLPAEVRLGLEVRALPTAGAVNFDSRVRERIQDRTAHRQITVQWDTLSAGEPARISDVVRKTLLVACTESGVPAREIVSWPNHDALFLATHGPSGMILVRNRGKVSHHRDESVRPEDLQILLEVLQRAVHHLMTPS
jgi:N-carbamoyl-L-amino-acid hydrolase